MPGMCPDGGTCHHNCRRVEECYRVQFGEPLSGVYPDDVWPDAVVEGNHLVNPPRVEQADVVNQLARAVKDLSQPHRELPKWTITREDGGVTIWYHFPHGTLDQFHELAEQTRRDLGLGPSPYGVPADNPESRDYRREVAAALLRAVDVDQYLIDAVRDARPYDAEPVYERCSNTEGHGPHRPHVCPGVTESGG